MQYIQNYFAVGNNVFLTGIVALLPLAFLFWALAYKRIRGNMALFAAWLFTLVIAVFVYRMPVGVAMSAAAYGAVQGMFPLCWLVFNAVLFHNLAMKSGTFEVVKRSIGSLSQDRRVQAILIGFCFSAFFEGTTAQGAPVAIAAAMLIALGFPPLKAVLVCLVGNTVPVPFGPLGMPTITIVNTAFGSNPEVLAAVTASVGAVMCLFALVIPVLMLVMLCGKRAALEALPLCLAAGIAYLIPNYLVTRYLGPEIPSLLSPIASLVVVIIFLRFWKPKTLWRFPDDSSLSEGKTERVRPGKVFFAWLPSILVTMFTLVWSLPAFKAFSGRLPFTIRVGPWPGLHGAVYRTTPIVEEAAVYSAEFGFDMFAAVGTALLIISLLVVMVYKMKPTVFGTVFLQTVKQLRFAIPSMLLVLSMAHVSNYSGISSTIGLAFAATGPVFMVFSPIIGFLGVFLTGSVTSSGALFGSIQRVTAEQLGINPLITITATMAGGVMGKLISPQSIAIGTAASDLIGQEGAILRRTSKYALVLLAMTIVLMLVLAYFFPAVF